MISIRFYKFCLSLLLFFASQIVFGQFIADKEFLKEHVYILASDSLEGRGTGTVGQKKAAKYIAEQFNEYGLLPLGEAYYDKFDVVKKHGDKASLKQGSNLVFNPWHFLYCSNYNHKSNFEGSMVFVGFGSNEEVNGRELEGKTIVLLANSPEEAFVRIKHIQSTSLNRLFFVIFPEYNEKVNVVWRQNIKYQKINLRSKYEIELEYGVKESWATLNGLDSVNVFYSFENALEKVFGKTDKELFELASRNLELTEDLLLELEEKEIQCRMNYYDTLEVLHTENITGFLRGKDTAKTIVLTAHYDHLGVSYGKIYYGADDNASGTAVLLEVARLLSAGEKPNYNVQFIAFSAEELGLLGSSEYVQHPFIPLSQILVNINMDMVGRWDEKHEDDKNFVYLLSAGDHSVNWFKSGKIISKELPISVSKKPGARERHIFTYGSDHYSFFQQGVPVVVVFTGLHDDYHTPQDVPDMINFDNLTNISTVLTRMIHSATQKK